MTEFGSPLPELPTKEALYSVEIADVLELFETYCAEHDPEDLHSTSSRYTMHDLTPPMVFPREIKEMPVSLGHVDVQVTKVATEASEVEVAIWKADDDRRADSPIATYELTDTYGPDQFVRISDTGTVLDRSRTTSAEVSEMIVGLALTREERLRISLAKSAGVLTSLGTLGSFSPLIEAGLKTNASETVRTEYYSFEIGTPADDLYYDVAITKTTEESGSESYEISSRSRVRDGGVVSTGSLSLTLQKIIGPDSTAPRYVLHDSGSVEIFDEDFTGSVTEQVPTNDALNAVQYIFDLYKAART